MEVLNMLVKGDKIKFIEDVGSFHLRGMIFEIIDVLENGMISVKNEHGIGILSYDDSGKYYKKVRELKWSNWIKEVDIRSHRVFFYKTNGKRIIVKQNGLKAHATCRDTDEFNLEKGIMLSLARLKVKQIMATM